MPNYDWVFWLNLTNIALGLVVVLAVLVVAYGLVWELVIRRKRLRGMAHVNAEMQARLKDEFPHHLAVPEFGLTMADGGEQVKTTAKQSAEHKHKNQS